jgi:N-acetylmuramoyl-L-alanine amidase
LKVVWLTGDYTGKHKERQRQAKQAGCDLVIEFHFNAANDSRAHGAEVWYRQYSTPSKVLAERLLEAIGACGFARRGVKLATPQCRAGFINAYANDILVVLLEPAFVTNREDAGKLHNQKVLTQLADRIADAIQQFARELRYRPIEVIGLSVGHKYKTSQPNDRGAKCILGDTEADHAETLARLVQQRLSARG